MEDLRQSLPGNSLFRCAIWIQVIVSLELSVLYFFLVRYYFPVSRKEWLVGFSLLPSSSSNVPRKQFGSYRVWIIMCWFAALRCLLISKPTTNGLMKHENYIRIIQVKGHFVEILLGLIYLYHRTPCFGFAYSIYCLWATREEVRV